jgi:hypothetical protein
MHGPARPVRLTLFEDVRVSAMDLIRGRGGHGAWVWISVFGVWDIGCANRREGWNRIFLFFGPRLGFMVDGLSSRVQGALEVAEKSSQMDESVYLYFMVYHAMSSEHSLDAAGLCS